VRVYARVLVAPNILYIDIGTPRVLYSAVKSGEIRRAQPKSQ